MFLERNHRRAAPETSTTAPTGAAALTCRRLTSGLAWRRRRGEWLPRGRLARGRLCWLLRGDDATEK